MALSTVADYLTEARAILQDTAAIKRYSDADLQSALGAALLAARKERPDLFIGRTVPVVDRTTAANTAITFDPQYQRALVYFVVSEAGLRDTEEADTARATGFRNKFIATLIGPET